MVDKNWSHDHRLNNGNDVLTLEATKSDRSTSHRAPLAYNGPSIHVSMNDTRTSVRDFERTDIGYLS